MGKSKRDEVTADESTSIPVLFYDRPRSFMVPYGGDVEPGKFRPRRMHAVTPGVNPPAEPEVWAQVRKCDTLKTMLDGDEPSLRSFESITDIHVELVERYAAQTGSLDALKWWLKADHRTLAKRKIQAQIELIEGKMARRRGKAA